MTVRAIVLFAIAWLAVSEARSNGPNSNCTSELLRIVASITRIDPANSTASIQKGTSIREGRVRDCVNAGETVVLKDKSQKVELLVRGKLVLVSHDTTPDGLYRVPAGAFDAVSTGASAWLSGFMDINRIMASPAQRPRPTYIPRGSESGEPAKVSPKPLSRVSLLSRLPTQLIASGSVLLLSWNDGTGPWTCRATAQGQRPVGESVSTTDNWWCGLRVEGSTPVRVIVEDALEQRLSWDIEVVSESRIPRPDWIAKPDQISAADRAAWALWLWSSAGPEWRLQALGMLNVSAEGSWLGGHAASSLLSDVPVIQPRR